MRRSSCLYQMITLSLLLSTLTHVTFSALIKSRNPASWPKPPCKMYYPTDPDYEAYCPDVVAYVCATNGLTYKNECFFCIDQWEFGRHIAFVKYGKCD
ncbi:serine protease inhibitor Kazal-type 13 [Peromyscus eremicus]|uniref:serine protease inhibitor Kazal-type 13 n=1 Tax=Peromyscus eremicus TaxID=42410 RepID=UPI0027DB13CB|nr:serine protease inhibitor Kazal-type 13 [Peromyscus eremicus]